MWFLKNNFRKGGDALPGVAANPYVCPTFSENSFAKNSLLVVVAVLLFLSCGVAFASDAANLSPAKSVGQISSAITLHPIAPNGVTSHANNKLKVVQSHNPPLSSPTAKSSLPVNAGQQHGPAVIGGANSGNAAKNGVINGTEIKRRP
jgi:hypothetical protein